LRWLNRYGQTRDRYLKIAYKLPQGLIIFYRRYEMEKNIFRGSFNRILHLMARLGPGATTIRPFLHKLRGVQINGKVFIGDDVYLENKYPECIEINNGSTVGLRSNLIAHFRGPGKIIIGKDVSIRMGCNIAASPGQILTIGDGSLVGMGSTVIKDVPPFTFVVGSPAKPKYKITVPMSLETSFEEWKNGLKPL
jgi:heptaprenylglycerol acetyltransferase